MIRPVLGPHSYFIGKYQAVTVGNGRVYFGGSQHRCLATTPDRPVPPGSTRGTAVTCRRPLPRDRSPTALPSPDYASRTPTSVFDTWTRWVGGWGPKIAGTPYRPSSLCPLSLALKWVMTEPCGPAVTSILLHFQDGRPVVWRLGAHARTYATAPCRASKHQRLRRQREGSNPQVVVRARCRVLRQPVR